MAVRTISGMVLTAGLAIAAWAIAQSTVFDPHGDPVTGVLRVATDPPTRGQCLQCHPQHGDDGGVNPRILFTANDNSVCFSVEGVSPCHQARPSNYPLSEIDRIPTGEPDAGYFEANSGGVRRTGVDFRGRWPGETVYRDPRVLLSGNYVSPHAQDPDMPRRASGGEGLCVNCHDPHGTPNRDCILEAYGGISGHSETRAPAAYRACLRCHGQDGPGGMDVANRTIEDFYDSGLNGTTAGHQIRRNPRIAISWPVHVQVGDKLACYDCHDPHGSAGYDGARPNAYLISDQRFDWSGLDATLKDAAQARHFCLGCHIASDGIPGSQNVQGIVMNTLSDSEAHRGFSAQSCNECHGSDYSSPTAHNVHNPSSGQDGGGFGREIWR
jgi:hypothetical protein